MTDQPTAQDEPLDTGAERPAAQPPGPSAQPGDHPVGAPPATGDPRVDEALAGLAGIAGQPPAEHVAVYEEVHRRLQDTLADLDDDG